MALVLSFSVTESNDNKTIVIQDTTGRDEATDWSQGGNIDFDDIDGDLDNALTTYGLALDITITTSDGTAVVYDTIDLYNEFGPFVVYPDDMSFSITCDMLEETGVALGTSEDEFPDGLYEITYSVINDPAGTPVTYSSTESTTLIYGQVKAEVYDKFREIPETYNCKECRDREINEALLCGAYLSGIESAVIETQEDELLNMLLTLEDIISNGSYYTW